MPHPCPAVIPPDDAVAAADGLVAAAQAYAAAVRECRELAGAPDSVERMTAAADVLYESYLSELLAWFPEAGDDG